MNEILKIAKSFESDLVQFLRDCVKLPHGSLNESQIIARMQKEMEDIGYDEVKVDPLGNLLGRIGNGKKVIVLDGHCDVVDIGNLANWQVDPIGGEIKDGKLFGRGTTDQKGGLTSAIYAGKVIKEIGIPEDVTLWVIASIMEEDCEGLCWKYIIEEDKLKPDMVLITEPTNLNIYRGHRGRMEIKVKVNGISSHGSAPERGVNAVYKMAPLIQQIEELHTRLKDDAFLGKGSVAVSEIKSTSPSLCAVADSCTIHLDRRLTAGETIESALAEIRELPAFKEGEGEVWVPEYNITSYTGLKYGMQKYFPTWVLEEDDPLIEKAVNSYKNLFNADPKVDKWTFSTNGVGIMGMYGIPNFGFGPGNEIYAHAPNEFIPVDHLHQAVAFYAEFIKKF